LEVVSISSLTLQDMSDVSLPPHKLTLESKKNTRRLGWHFQLVPKKTFYAILNDTAASQGKSKKGIAHG